MNTDLPNTITVSEIASCISQGRPLGIYAYMLHLEGSIDQLEELTSVFCKYSDCAFLCFVPDEMLSSSTLQSLKACTNVMTCFSSSGQNSMANCLAMRKNKSLYGIYAFYNDKDAEDCLSGKKISDIVKYEAFFSFLISDGSCSVKTAKKVAKYCRASRLHPEHPVVLFDLLGDILQIGRIISTDECYFELLENGDIRTEKGLISDFRHTISLEQLLLIAHPKKTEAKN